MKTYNAVTNNKITSTIHPEIIEHVVRESKRAIYSLQKLQIQ